MKKLTPNEFKEKASIKHKGKYDYSISNYTTSKAMIDIICPIHGKFTQWANSHLRGKGCKSCAILYRADLERQSKEEYISKASKVHSSFYSYEKLEYIDVHTKSVITCPIHGDFTQKLNSHLAGQGCKECGKRAAGNSKTFFKGKRTILYVIEAAPGLYKVGITSKASVTARYKHKILQPYTIVFQCSFFDGYEAFMIERQIINNFKHFNYIGVPILKKTKNTEILTVNPVNYIQQLMKDFHASNRN